MQPPVQSELELLLNVLPERIGLTLRSRENLADLLEVVMDLGRNPEARFLTEDVILSEDCITTEDLSELVSKIGEFGQDNRAGIERTLHRISAIRNRKGHVIGITC